MSRRVADTKFGEWVGPVGNDPARPIQDHLDGHHMNGALLLLASQRVSEFMGRIAVHAQTADGYRWFFSVQFRLAHGDVAILVPWFQDWLRDGDSQADRAVNAYIRGEVTRAELAALVESFVAACQSVCAEQEAAQPVVADVDP